MLYQARKKDVMNGFKNVISIGYCGAYHLLNCESRNAYTAGVNGRGADVFVIDGDTAIVTGYRPFGNIRPSHELVKRYEAEAEKMTRYNYECWEDRRGAFKRLLTAFITDAIAEHKNA